MGQSKKETRISIFLQVKTTRVAIPFLRFGPSENATREVEIIFEYNTRMINAYSFFSRACISPPRPCVF